MTTKSILIACLAASALIAPARAETFAPNQQEVANNAVCAMMSTPTPDEEAKTGDFWNVQNFCTTPVAAYIMVRGELVQTVDNLVQNEVRVTILATDKAAAIITCMEDENLFLDDQTGKYACGK